MGIKYDRLWVTLKAKKHNKNWLRLQKIDGKPAIHATTINKLIHGETVTTETLARLCYLLECPLSDIVHYERDETLGKDSAAGVSSQI
jgi:DNA-binding Xre family transcriptional regulator